MCGERDSLRKVVRGRNPAPATLPIVTGAGADDAFEQLLGVPNLEVGRFFAIGEESGSVLPVQRTDMRLTSPLPRPAMKSSRSACASAESPSPDTHPRGSYRRC